MVVLSLVLAACGSGGWPVARGADSVDGYRHFLATHPASDEHAPVARRRIETLLYRDAERVRSPRAYRGYRAEYPGGAFAGQALAGLVEARRFGALRERRARPALERAAQDPDPEVRAAAARALARLGTR